jgi:DNA-binding NarL/FixJ family response regulator
MIKLVIADDHTLIREGLKSLLKEESSIEVVGEARNIEELISILDQNQSDIVLMDLSMPLEIACLNIREVHNRFPDLKILVLSPVYNEETINQIFKEGALGYIHQNSERDELIYALHSVNKGNKFISPFISLNLIEKVERPSKLSGFNYEISSATQSPPVDISNREREVLFLIAQGYTNAEIADKLFTSKRTIESHRKNLIDKTKTKNTASLIRYAFTNGILSN